MANLENQVESKYDSLMQSAGDISQRVRSGLGHASAEITSRANEYVKQGRDQVQKKPLQSVAVVAAAGFLAGVLFMVIRRARADVRA